MYRLVIELTTGTNVIDVEDKEVFEEILRQYETADIISVEGVNRKFAFNVHELVSLDLVSLEVEETDELFTIYGKETNISTNNTD